MKSNNLFAGGFKVTPNGFSAKMFAGKLGIMPESGGDSRSPWYCKFNGVNGYGQFDRAVEIGAGEGFSVHVEGEVSTLSSGNTILSGETQGNNELVVGCDANGLVRVFMYSGTVLQEIINSTTPVTSYSSIDVTIANNGDVSLAVNGVIEARSVWDVSNIKSIMNIGTRPGVWDFFPGVLSNVKITTNDEILVDCLLDQKGEEIQTNRADPTNNLTLHNVDPVQDWYEDVDGLLLSHDRIINGDFSDGSIGWNLGGNWVVADNARAECYGEGNSSLSQDTVDFVTGETYVMRIRVVDMLSGTLVAFVGTGAQSIVSISSAGEYVVEFTSTVSSPRLLIQSYAFNGSVDNISIRRKLGYV